jgi:two-component sensor histidine kinase
VADEGAGLPAGFDLDSTPRLGLRIVRTLVEGELRGSLSVQPGPTRGALAVLRVPLEQGA